MHREPVNSLRDNRNTHSAEVVEWQCFVNLNSWGEAAHDTLVDAVSYIRLGSTLNLNRDKTAG